MKNLLQTLVLRYLGLNVDVLEDALNQRKDFLESSLQGDTEPLNPDVNEVQLIDQQLANLKSL